MNKHTITALRKSIAKWEFAAGHSRIENFGKINKGWAQ